ncbi:Hypothetical protein GLP15_2168 [Giardia lamblia P15]|uniref:Uncharacterized protein n=1 Tax=Giardia intestinalis (strain P15) TaxID=658858 RepID=E1F6Y1_GIAIA|nr:Hypothetical protein GLP15_2168 [Giardia lamblia P15]
MAPKKQTGMVKGGKTYVAQVPNARGEYSIRDEHYVSPDPRPSSQELRAASQRNLVAKLTGGPAKVTSTEMSEPEKKRPPSAKTNPDHSSQEADGSSQHQYDANLISDNITKRDITRDHYPPILRQFLALGPDEAVRRLVNDVNLTDVFVVGSNRDQDLYLRRLSAQAANLANFFNAHRQNLVDDKINANTSVAEIVPPLVSHIYDLYYKATNSDYKPSRHVWDKSVGSFYSNEKDLGKNIVSVPQGSEQFVLDKFSVPNTAIRSNLWKPLTVNALQPPDEYDSEILKAFQTKNKTEKLELYEDIVEDAFLVFLPLTVNFLVNQLKKANKAERGILDDRLSFDEDMTNLQLYLNELTDKRNAFISPDSVHSNVEKIRNIDNAFSTYPLINQLISRLVDWDIGNHVFKHPSVAWEDAAGELIDSKNIINRNQQDARELAETIVRATDLAARLEHHVKGVDTEETPLLKTHNYLKTDPESGLFVTEIIKERGDTLKDLVKVLTHFQNGTFVPDIMKTKGTVPYSFLDKVYNKFFDESADEAYSEESTSRPELGPNDPKAGEYLGREIIDHEREVAEASDFKPPSISQILESQSAPQETSKSLISETSERLINSLAARGYNISKLPPRGPVSPASNQPDEESTIPLVTEASVPLTGENLVSLNALHQTFTNLASKILNKPFYDSDLRQINELSELILNQFNDQKNTIKQLHREQERLEQTEGQSQAMVEWAQGEINKNHETIRTMDKEAEALREEQRRLQNQLQERTREVGLIQEELKNQATVFGARLSEIEKERTQAIDELNQRKVAHEVQITKLTAEAQRLQQALQQVPANNALASQNAALRDELSLLRDQLRDKQDQILQLEAGQEEIAQQYQLLERERAVLETAAQVLTQDQGIDAEPVGPDPDQEIDNIIQAALNAPVPQLVDQALLNYFNAPEASALQGRVGPANDLLVSHLASVRDRLDAANERLNQAQMATSDYLDQARATNNNLTAELEQTKASLAHTNSFAEQLKRDNRVINQANLELGRQLELKEAVNQDLQRQLTTVIGELNQLGPEKTEREAYILQLLTERELAANQLRVKEAEVVGLGNQLKNLTDQLTNVQGKLSISEADLKHYKARTRDLEEDLDKKDAELEEYQQEGFQRARLLDDKNAVIRDLTEKIQEATKETAEAQEQTANTLRDIYIEDLRARRKESARIDAHRLRKEIDFDIAARKQELANQERELIHRLKANERAEERTFRAQEMMFQGEREDARRGADHQRRIDRLNLETAGRREDREHRAALDLSRQATRGNMSLNARTAKNKASAGLISKLAGSTDPVIKALGTTMFTSYLKDLTSLSDDELMGTNYEQLIKMHDDGSIDRIIAALATPSNAINDTLGKRISDLENTTRNFINMVSQRTAHVGAAQAYHPPRRVFVGRDGRAYQGNRRARRVAKPRRLPPRNSRGRFVRRVKK